MASLEFFFDCSSPWTYLAFTRIQPIAERAKIEIAWRPILVGGVFNAVNREVYDRRANPDTRKAAYYEKDLQDWARLAGLSIGKPLVFPVRAVSVMRCCVAAEAEGALVGFAREAFAAYWSRLEDISQDGVMMDVAKRAGLDGARLLARCGEPDVKTRLKQNTDELIDRGGFGSPTLFVNGRDMYFGNDRLPLVEAALARTS